MKTRIEFGSDHVQIICSKAVANAIGSAIVSVNDGPIGEQADDLEFMLYVGQALEQDKDFEEEEPV